MNKIVEGTTLWVSKYALSEGIKEVVMEKAHDDESPYIYPSGYYTGYRLGKEIHLTKAVALVAAEDMRVKKIASLKKQLQKLEKLSFAG